MALEITKMLVLSTRHVPKDLGEKMDEWSRLHTLTPIIVYEKIEAGWFVVVPDEMVDVHGNPDMPPELIPLFVLAVQQGCEWIMFDCDGPEVEGLEIWSW